MGDTYGIVTENIVNQALVALGAPRVLGSIRDGSKEAAVALELYVPTMEETFRAAHWSFARRQAAMTLLQDASMQSQPPVGTGTPGMGLWIYEYAYPIDCMQAIAVPITGNIQTPVPTGNITPPSNTSPQTTLPSLWPVAATIPAPFQITSDMIPNLTGAITAWNQLPDLDNTAGQGYGQQTVILTNQQKASLIYTSRVASPNIWDPLFRQAMVCKLAAKMALAVLEDKTMALKMQALVIQSAKSALDIARTQDGNESPSSTRREASWIAGRMSGGGWYGAAGATGVLGGYLGPGVLYNGWSMSPFPDGTMF